MELEIRKESNEKYLSIKMIGMNENDYQFQMLLNNRIKGLLPLRIRNINNEKELLYEITNMTSINNIFQRSLMRKDDLIKFVFAIKQLEESLKEYLLDSKHVFFDLNYIFFRTKQNQYYFCYCPEVVDDFSLQMKSLFNQLLDYVNYNDREAVSLAYGMQEIASRDDFSLEELLDFAMHNKEKEKPIEIEEEDVYEEEDDESDYKETFIDRIKKVFNKNKKTEELDNDDWEDNYYIEETQTNINDSFETDNIIDEEATVLLTQQSARVIALKSVNANPEIVVLPDKYPYIIGKSRRSSDYRVSSNVVSRVHARINYENEEFTIEDLNSTNGTFVNDERLKPHEVKSIERGDVIKLADLEFVVE